MFLIREDTVILGPPNSPMSHRDWFESIGLDGKKTIEECVRGFVDDRGLFFYTGKDFNTDEKIENELMTHLSELANALCLSPKTNVYSGVIKTKDVRFPPKKEMGTINDLLKKQ